LKEKSLEVLSLSSSDKLIFEKISLRILLVESSLAMKSQALSNLPQESTSLLTVDLCTVLNNKDNSKISESSFDRK